MSLKGHLLVASSTIVEENFSNTVILLASHNEQGAFGFILNRPGIMKLGDMLHGLPQEYRQRAVYQGGPVQTEAIFVLHADKSLGISGEEIFPGVFLGYQFELLADLINNQSEFQLFHGYSGWGTGQLEQEIEAKSWITLPAEHDDVFSRHPDLLWRESLIKKGGLYRYFAANVKNPALN